LRAALKAAFPATRFSVRLARGTAYGMCHVDWTDGPTYALVDAVVQPFSGEGFDGMTDSSFSNNALLADGRQSGLRLILSNRNVSPALARRAADQVAAFYGVPVPEIVAWYRGYTVTGGERSVVVHGPRWSDAIYQASNDATRFQRKRFTVSA
jgi:hypothetical protein